MQHEIDSLRMQAEMLKSKEAEKIELPLLPPALETRVSVNQISPSALTFSEAPAPEVSEGLPPNPHALFSPNQPSTLNRTLQGVELEAHKINDCLSL
jgi:hypothetical protein